jgi:hypothetical protein
MELPDLDRAWDHENAFWLSCGSSRLSKALAQYELFKKVLDLPGAIVECGVFKGASFSRFAMLRELLASTQSRRLIGFDTFDRFPETNHQPDVAARERFIESAGDTSISVEQLREVLRRKDAESNTELVPGDINETVPASVEEHPELRIALLNIDTDVYEPAVTALEHLYERVVPDGIVVLDDYGVFPGESSAVDEFFADPPVRIERFPWAPTPSFIRKRHG